MTRWLRTGAVALGIALLAGACSAGPTAGQRTGDGTFTVVAPNSAPTFTENFNPFTADAPGLNIIYEPLVASNRAKGGEVLPWLAESWSWSADGRTATFKLRPGVKFSDGSPLSVDDVVFSLDLRLTNEEIGGATYTAVKAAGTDAVAVTWKDPAYQQIGDLQDVTVLRKALWAGKNPVTYVDKKPVGTGPVALSQFSPQGVTMAARSDYWGGQLAFKQLKYVAATAANIQTQLQQNTIDFCTCDVDAKSYVAADKERHRFIMAWDGAVVSLILNTAKAPLNDVHVRRALQLAVDTAAISKLSSSKIPIVQPPANPTGLSSKTYADWIDPELAAPRTQDVAAAKRELAAGGYTIENGQLVKAGKPLPLKYVAPNDTPFLKTIAQLVVDQLDKGLGLKVQLTGGPGSNVSTAIAKGEFDIAANWLSSGRGIYPAMNGLNGTAAEPLGTEAASNPGRFKNASFDRLLVQMAGTEDTARLKELGKQAQAIVADQVPTVPLFDSGAAGVANTTRWTGWPETDQPEYLANTGSGTEFITTLKNLKPANG
jgi:peptide/nickel transport system substrate-binding protein